MSERLIALADAADANCKDCGAGEFASHRRSVQPGPFGERPMHYRSGGERGRFCKAWGTRQIVEDEHPGLGSKPTQEWRRFSEAKGDK